MRPTLAIGPANYAGQAWAWAEAVKANLDAGAWAFAPDRVRGTGFRFPRHRRISVPSYYFPFGRLTRASRLVSSASHLILDGYRPVLYQRNGFPIQARYLRKRGPELGLMAHGTDVRDPDAHLARFEYSYFAEGDQDWLAQRRVLSARNREFGRSLGVELFVSTPDMLFDLPEATWVPVCTEISAWECDHEVLRTDRPRVLFIPSQRNPPVKGTRYVDPVLSSLHEQGVIEYIAPSGVPHSQMIDLVKSVDVVVDQLLFGSYGVAAVEAMAAGKVVIGNISTLRTRDDIELPGILDATPKNLKEIVTSLKDRADELNQLAEQNRAFVRRWHDGRESAGRLAPFLGITE